MVPVEMQEDQKLELLILELVVMVQILMNLTI